MDEMRKRYIIAEALYVAANHLGSLPEKRRPESNIADMREILETDYAAELPMVEPLLPPAQGTA